VPGTACWIMQIHAFKDMWQQLDPYSIAHLFAADNDAEWTI